MVKPDILRQPWLNYRGRNITGCECAHDYFKLFLFSYDNVWELTVYKLHPLDFQVATPPLLSPCIDTSLGQRVSWLASDITLCIT